MRLVNFVLFGVVVLSASCHRAPVAKGLTDGCYYARGKPVFKIAGAHGRVLIGGSVQSFDVQAGQDSEGMYATFTPGFFFDQADLNGVPLSVDTDPEREPFRLPMRPRTRVPTVEMNWTTYGHEDASLGKPC